ncbi:MAG: hypothetical protein K8R53_06305 [Bacteroidales bacterium]|nr:hypothetical protein [Bacteroidales bacterium]
MLRANDLQNGEICFSDISFDPFVHFPVVSIRLQEFVYLGNPIKENDSAKDTIANFNNLYAAINLWDLVKGDITISQITLNGGELRLIKNNDGAINLFHALGLFQNNETPIPTETDAGIMSDTTGENTLNDTLEHQTSGIIYLDKIALKKINLKYTDRIEKSFSNILIEEMKASFIFENDTIKTRLNTDLNLVNLQAKENLILTDKRLSVNTAIVFDQNLNKLYIDPTQLTFEKVKFNLEGIVDFSEDVFLDLSIEGSDENFSIFNLLLTESGLKNLKSGIIYFEGAVKGSFDEKIPNIKIDFGLEDVTIYIPEVDQYISDLNLEGHLNSGTIPDFSDASLRINKLTGGLPGGHINAILSLNNFVIPKIDYLCDIKADVTGFDETFKLYGLDSLKGNIKIYDEFTGTYNQTTKMFDEEKSNSTIVFDSLSFEVADFIRVDCMDGSLTRNTDTLKLIDLKLNTGHSDMILNGSISTLLDLILHRTKEISTDLHIVSDTFDLPRLFAFEPIVGHSFPYRLTNLDLQFHAETNTDKLLDFESVPEIRFEILGLGGTIENLFPPITIYQGDILLTEKEGRIYMEFQNFLLEVVNSNLQANVSYYSPPVDPDFVSAEVSISDLNPGKLILFDKDSIPPVINGKLNGFVKTDLEIGLDTFDFESFNIITGELFYITKNDTIGFDQLAISANEISIGEGSAEQPLADLSFDAVIKASRIYSGSFDLDHVSYDVNANKGIFTVYPGKIRFFGKEGKGIYKLSPFEDTPTYEVKYSIDQFQVKEFLSNLLSDTILVGKMDLDMNVVLSESDDGNIFSNIDGYINISGENLTLHGIDIDKVLEKYKRSQKFNLTDLGAVAIAGPFGLLLTKGSDFARLALGNIGETTPITNFISTWDMVKGNMILKDVAFSTEKNLIAGKGSIDLATDSLDVTIAVLDKNGCSILSQTDFGTLENPQQSELKIVSTVFGPITNIFDGALGKDCEVFYNGKLSHTSEKN